MKESLRANSKAYKILNLFAESVRLLREGSQVFIYKKDLFGITGGTSEEEFTEYSQEVAEVTRSIAVEGGLEEL